ncbi:hypothetical protein AGOR_G00125290 [Albula goreensis]|uniref:Tower domain-containing protein n=1 Tax=Albula goreensis TaxID=1534307 RepID=A0A8T3DBM0_9TELE|nr:hypothetical protein AGOR_G00125290 [Albula goreensis]
MLNPDQTTGHHSTQLIRNDPVSPGSSVYTLKPSVLVKPALKVEDWGMMQSSTDGAPQGGSSLLNLHSLGLRYCTVTQQKYLEQEAMACTRALLEDEDQAEFGLQGATGGLSQPSATAKSSDGKEAERSRGVKRLVSDDSDLTDQPPLKRQLLAEFDRTSDCGKKKMLIPLKSNPNVILRDRRTFRYGVPLQPKVTQPYGEKKAVLDQRPRKMEPQIIAPDSFFQDSKLANHRGTVFVPPFQRCPKPEAQRASQPQESRRPSSVFVPPFRKTQSNPNSNLGEGSGHAQHRFSEASPAVAVFSPPFKKTLSCTTDPGEAQQERPTLTPASPDEHETAGSDPKQILESLQLARDLQDMKIRKKRRQVIRPQPGSLFLAKTSGVTRVSLRSAVGGRYPLLHTKKELYSYGVHREVSQVSSNSAESFRFHCGDFFRGEVLTAGAGVQLADGGWLIPSDDGTAGKEEFYRALCDTPGVDPKLISEGWLYNHYRWVVWKRASMERSFPSVMGSHCLTPEQVLLQLKYRYDIEVDQSRRSALRKIIERDDTPAKTLVVCVCGIVSTGSSSAPTPTRPAPSETKTSPGTNSRTGSSAFGIIWVTDGWYAIKAVLDAPLTAMLLKGRIPIGGKLVAHGAELVGPQDACSPLEAPDSLMLKISANSTRRARWDTRLGFHSDPRPFRLPLSSLHKSGGLVGCVDIVVLRSYPTQWMEKKPGGVFIFRNDRAEEREARRHADSKHKAMELLFTKIQTQFEKEQEAKTKGKRSRRLTNQEIEALQDGEELYEAVESDPVYLESSLNEQQLSMLNNYRQSLGQERQARLQERFQQALAEAQESEGSFPRRDVTPVWKLSICDFTDQQSRIVYLLNIWRHSMELRSLLKEGCRYRVYQLATSEGKKRGSSAVIQLTATKKTQFQQVQASPQCVPEFQPRVSVSFRALQGQGFSPLCGEVDIVGYVLSIAEKQGPSPILYLVDEHQEFASVRIYAGLAQLGLEELVKPRTLLALSNLKLWHQSPTHLPALYTGELTVFSTNPKEPHLQEACSHLRSNVQGNKSFFQMAEERLSSFTRSSVPSSLLSPRKVGSSPKLGNEQMPQQSVQTSGFFTPLSRKPPLPIGASNDRDPKSLKRKRGLDFLSRIPSPPPLSPLLGGASPSVKNTFNPPRRSGTPHATSHRQTPHPAPPPAEMAEWVNDEELAMINTQALIGRLEGQEGTGESR